MAFYGVAKPLYSPQEESRILETAAQIEKDAGRFMFSELGVFFDQGVVGEYIKSNAGQSAKSDEGTGGAENWALDCYSWVTNSFPNPAFRNIPMNLLLTSEILLGFNKRGFSHTPFRFDGTLPAESPSNKVIREIGYKMEKLRKEPIHMVFGMNPYLESEDPKAIFVYTLSPPRVHEFSDVETFYLNHEVGPNVRADLEGTIKELTA